MTMTRPFHRRAGALAAAAFVAVAGLLAASPSAVRAQGWEPSKPIVHASPGCPAIVSLGTVKVSGIF